jgi:dTDP-4-dehydrorhamnose 3,5-epimerase
MKILKTDIPEVLIIEPDVFSDDRGFFMEMYRKERYTELGLPEFVQDNLSFSKDPGTLRGLHYQSAPYAQGKFVSVFRGEVFDVAVDIRRDSPTFGKHVSVMLSAENKRQFYIPPGFAHAFQTTQPDTLFAYKCTNNYSKEHDRGILWNDPELGIDWPIKEGVILSEKDTTHPTLASLETDPVRWEELRFE